MKPLNLHSEKKGITMKKIACMLLFVLAARIIAADTPCDSCIAFTYLTKEEAPGKAIGTGAVLFLLVGPLGLLGCLNNKKWVPATVCLNKQPIEWFYAFDENYKDKYVKFSSIDSEAFYNQYKSNVLTCMPKNETKSN